MDEKGVAWVTGASRGMGRVLAGSLAASGWSVVISARPRGDSTTALDAAAAEIRAGGGECLALPCDVRRVRQVGACVRAIAKRYGRCDLLVNNAGIMGAEKGLADCPPALWQEIIQTNLTGPYLCTRAVLPLMLDSGGGLIINITSGAAVRTGFLNIPYGVSKAGLDRFTLGLAAEYGARGIRCLSLSPPVTDTDTVRRLYPGRDLSGFAAPPELTARALLMLLDDDIEPCNGRVVSVREYLRQRDR